MAPQAKRQGMYTSDEASEILFEEVNMEGWIVAKSPNWIDSSKISVDHPGKKTELNAGRHC